MSELLAERLWARVDVAGPDECWNWDGAIGGHQTGGNQKICGKQYATHRLAWTVTNGEIPPGMTVAHECYNPRCCNPAHLLLLTNPDAARRSRSNSTEPDPVVRFWSNVRKTPTCWEWTGTLTSRNYGVFKLTSKRQVYAHRHAYELVRDPIPVGLFLDHLCRNTKCVNPSHLEPVTNAENVMRGFSIPATNARRDTCAEGHEYRWVWTTRRGKRSRRRYCPTCNSIKGKARYRRRMAERKSA